MDADVIRVLGSTQIFGDLDEPSLARVAATCTQRTYRKGQYLCYQGDPGDRLVIVIRGSLRVVLGSEHGEEIVLATLGPSDVFGELAVFDGSPRSASVLAATPCVVLSLHREAVLELLGREPAVLAGVLRTMGGLIRRLTEQTGDFVFLDLAGRLAKLLLRLAGDDVSERGPTVLDTGLSQSDLASMIGATRPAVNRALQTLAKRGLISVKGKAVTILDVDALRRRASV